MKKYIDSDWLLDLYIIDGLDETIPWKVPLCVIQQNILDAPAAEVVDIDTVAQILYDTFGDRCACNYNGNDEWLWEYCELVEECPHPADKLGCWRQYVKHYKRKEEYERTFSET